MSEKQPDTPVVHLPWSHYQAILDRLDALEAAVFKLGHHALHGLQQRDRPELSVLLAKVNGYVPAAAPPPPAAAPEPDNGDGLAVRISKLLHAQDDRLQPLVWHMARGISERIAEVVAAAPAPDVIERVRKALSEFVEKFGPYMLRRDIEPLRDALRLLGARP